MTSHNNLKKYLTVMLTLTPQSDREPHPGQTVIICPQIVSMGLLSGNFRAAILTASPINNCNNIRACMQRF
jgi:hypothetical protein